jgi:hypothetical protein
MDIWTNIALGVPHHREIPFARYPDDFAKAII